MMNLNHNHVILCGTVAAHPTYSHESYGRDFYRMELQVCRLPGTVDQIPVLVDSKTLETVRAEQGCRLKVYGSMRSVNYTTENHRKLVLFVFAQRVEETEEQDSNQIILTGTLCKPAVLRSTPFGRLITDLLLAVGRPNSSGRSDYLPCVAWGRLAKQTYLMHMGGTVTLRGRVQSRAYTKVVDGIEETRTAYEVSVMELIGHESMPAAA